MNVSPLFPAQPVSPVAAYIGGKRLLAKRLVPMINAVPHTLYAEPFVGMGGRSSRGWRRFYQALKAGLS